jgi:hypothetical protein
MDRLEREYDLKLQTLDIATQNAINEKQKEIDAIDAQTEAEDEARRQEEEQRRVAALKKRISEEDDSTRKKELQQDLSDLLYEIQRRAELKVREIQKDNLRDEIADIKTEAKTKEEQIRDELRIRQEVAADSLQVQLGMINDRKLAEETALEEEIARIQTARIAAEAGAKAKLDATITALNTEEELAKTNHLNEMQRIEDERIAFIKAEEDKTKAFLLENEKRRVALLGDDAFLTPGEQYTKLVIERGYASGGIVPGAYGTPVRALLHGGEMVLNPQQQRDLFNGGLRDVTVNVSYYVPNLGVAEGTNADLLRRIRRLGGGLTV